MMKLETKRRTKAAATMSAADALAAVRDIDASLDDVVDLAEAGDPSATEAGAMLVEAINGLGFDALGEDLDDDVWHDVADETYALYARLAVLAGGTPEPQDDSADADDEQATADEPDQPKRNSAVADQGVRARLRVGNRSAIKRRGRRGMDPAPLILDAFYGGLYYAGKAAWWSVKTAVKLSIAAGKLAAPHVARAARAAGRGIAAGASAAVVHVASYIRSDGTKIPAHDRASPGKRDGREIAVKGIAIKADSIADDGTFEGYGSLFGELDNGGDIVAAGAFAKSLAAHKAAGTMPQMLWNHDEREPIGVWLEMAEDAKGLRCKGRLLLDVQRAREVYALMKAGAIDGLSIGYRTIESHYKSLDEAAKSFGWYGIPECASAGSQARVLTECELWEVSPVTFPMLSTARVDNVKASKPPALDMSSIAAALSRRGKRLGRLQAKSQVDANSPAQLRASIDELTQLSADLEEAFTEYDFDYSAGFGTAAQNAAELERMRALKSEMEQLAIDVAKVKAAADQLRSLCDEADDVDDRSWELDRLNAAIASLESAPVEPDEDAGA